MRRYALLLGFLAFGLGGCDRANNPILPSGDPIASSLFVLVTDGVIENGIVNLTVYVQTDLAPVTDLVPGNFYLMVKNDPVIIDPSKFTHVSDDPGHYTLTFNKKLSESLSITVTYGSLVNEIVYTF